MLIIGYIKFAFYKVCELKHYILQSARSSCKFRCLPPTGWTKTSINYDKNFGVKAKNLKMRRSMPSECDQVDYDLTYNFLSLAAVM